MAALLPCAGAIAIIYSGSICQTYVGRVLASFPMVSIGLMSYSLYLWHWPILVYARYWYGNEFTTSVSLKALAASYGCAYLSYRFVETPFRRASGKAVDFSTILAAIAVTLVVVFAAAGVYLTDIAKLRYSQSQLLAFEDQSWTGEKYIGQMPKDVKSGLHILGAVELDGNPCVLVWGDSHTAAYSEIVHYASKSVGKKSLIGFQLLYSVSR